MKTILLVSHGSQSPKTKQEITLLVDSLQKNFSGYKVEFAFLEIESPGIPEAIDRCVARGSNRVVLCLNFLNSGRHVDEDIPAIVKAAQKKYPGVEFLTTKPLGQHKHLSNLFIDLINNA